MRAVGIRELKNRLSEYLRQVQNGERVLVTDRGRVIAELRPPGAPDQTEKYPGLHDMARSGALRLGQPNRADLYPSLPPAAPEHPDLSSWLLEQDRSSR
jgi:antitoxin (DNA-binding transcriptional repressor) of toxin-antitoxin stability system